MLCSCNRIQLISSLKWDRVYSAISFQIVGELCDKSLPWRDLSKIHSNFERKEGKTYMYQVLLFNHILKHDKTDTHLLSISTNVVNIYGTNQKIHFNKDTRFRERERYNAEIERERMPQWRKRREFIQTRNNLWTTQQNPFTLGNTTIEVHIKCQISMCSSPGSHEYWSRPKLEDWLYTKCTFPCL